MSYHDDYHTAADLIAGFESYSENAYWDVNAWRIGYGSDTEGVKQVPVYKGMKTTRGAAHDNLMVRIPQYARVVRRQIGDRVFEALPQHARDALLSVAYNYGSLPSNIVFAATHGGVRDISAAIKARENDNHGVNKKRRDREAAYCLA